MKAVWRNPLQFRSVNRMMKYGDLEKIKQFVFDGDNTACFIERERILARLSTEMEGYQGGDREARIIAGVLSGVSVPLYDCDYFAGRVVEAQPDAGMEAPSRLIASTGHMSPDYEKLLRLGLSGILDEIRTNAARKGTPEAKLFCENAEIIINAVRDYALRYACEAEKQGRTQMAEALRRVPYEPAYDLYSALQGIWLIHMIASCYVGGRDYAFGRFDQYMLPYYEKAVADGMTEDEAAEMLAGFFVKCNEICGRTTHNYKKKPILSNASKQYVNIGGEHPNAFSYVVLRAQMLNNMAQPQTTVLLKSDADPAFTDAVFKAMAALTDKLHIYNYDLVEKSLIAKGLPVHIAKDHSYSACCTFDLHWHNYRREFYVPVLQIFLKTLSENTFDSVDGLLEVFKGNLAASMQEYADSQQYGDPVKRPMFAFSGLLMPDSCVECEYPTDGNSPYSVMNMFCPGVATLGDSLMVLDRLVFKGKRFGYDEFIRILKSDYAGHEELRQEILSWPRFGNDTDDDDYTVRAGNAFLDAVDSLDLKPNFLAFGGFYSLERDNTWREQVGATPDGRHAFEPFSENQSPTYGADKSGITSLLNSVSKLPFDRAVTGGLNITFSRNYPPEILKALAVSYFEKGGLHMGISVVDKEVLRDAMVHPEKYRALTVRLYGFSEYFVSLPEWQQIAVINRTAY